MEIRTSWIQRVPGWQRIYRHLLPLYPRAIESFDLSGYDLVISSSHCVAKGARAAPGATHLCYCHTPMRYAWDQYRHYFAPERLAWWNRRAIPALIGRMRAWDVATAGRPHRYAANSRHVAGPDPERLRPGGRGDLPAGRPRPACASGTARAATT